MKKLILIVLALTLACGGGVAFAGYDEGAYVHNVESSKGTSADPTRVYMLVRYAEITANGRSLSTGEVVVWDCVSDDGVTIGLVGDVGSADSVAGVVVGTIPTADNTGASTATVGFRNWGYIQTYGYCTKAMVLATAAAGGALACNDTANGSYAIPVVGLAVNGGKYTSIFGFALDAVAANAEDVEIFIKNR